MARAALWLSGGGGAGTASANPCTTVSALAALPRDVWDKIVECLVGWDLLPLACVSRGFHSELLADAVLWSEALPQPQHDGPRAITKTAIDAKRAYASKRSFRFRGQSTQAVQHGGDRGACIEALRFLPTSSQRDVELFVPLAPRKFSIDVWFSLQSQANGETFTGGIILGAQSARWQDAMVWPDYHRQFIHIGPTGDLYCSVVGDKRVVAPSLKLRRWYHLALVFDMTHECVYLDGELVRRTVGPLHRDWRSLYFMQIGTGCISAGSVGTPTPKFSGWYAFNGVIDELRMWEDVLTASQVKTLAQDSAIDVKATGAITVCGSSTHLGSVEQVRCSRPRERACVEWTNHKH